MAVNLPYYGLWNRGPLTTTFTPPSTCLATTTVYVLGYENAPIAQASSYYIGLWPPALPDYLVDTTSNPCIPPGPTPAPLYQPWYYSPGICPSSYTPGLPLAVQTPGVTAWLCCPLSYTPSPHVSNALFTATFACVSTAPSLATLTSVWSAPHGDSIGDTVWPTTVPTAAVTPTVVLTKPTVMAIGIPIMWQSTDLEAVSWFDNFQSSSSPLTTTPVSTHSTISPIVTHSSTTPSSTHSIPLTGSNPTIPLTTSPNPVTTSNSTSSITSSNHPSTTPSKAASMGRGPSWIAVILGAVLLVPSFIL
ncbi:hypothetical protein F5884DRAFT_790511 [Xylogone sp. PMI_703]|nr:hypothetical protein F5884DRAFT_790511 [Xylogone sp. PMI_703]